MVKHIASILSQGRLEIDHNNCVVNIISKVTNSIIYIVIILYIVTHILK